MRFDAVVVPRGAEARAVERGWPAPRPALLTVPAGAAAARSLIDGVRLNTVLVLGLCGALDPALRIGDAVVYARISDGGETIELDPQLAAGCAQALACAPAGAAEVTRFVGQPAAKAALRARTGASAVDMEGAALARELHRRGARVAMVRLVSDEAAADLPDLGGVFDEAGALKPVALAVALLRSPLRGARFIAHALRALDALSAAAKRLAFTEAG